MNRSWLGSLLHASCGRVRGLVGMALLALLAGCGRVGGTAQLPAQDSTIAAHVDFVYYFIFWLSVIYFVHIMVLMLYFLVRYRRRPGVEVEESPHHNLALEIFWSVPPAILVVFMFWYGFTGYLDMRTPPKDAYKIQCIAKQWDFRYIYPNGVKSTELHVPPNEPIEMVLESEDVLHAFFIPKFRVKQDIVPGRFTEVWFEATRPTDVTGGDPKNKHTWDHRVFCAEYCGTSHSRMWSRVVVHESREAFEKWLSDADVPMTGEDVYKMYCASCHFVAPGISVGPSFKGLFGSTRKVFNTKTGQDEELTADEAYIEESIRDPGVRLSRVGKEFGNNMTPGIANKLRPDELKNLIEYIKGLK